MRKIRLIASTIILSSASALSFAQTTDEHNAHHPGGTGNNETSISDKSLAADPALLKQKMDTHMKAMNTFHENLQKATPDERRALMSEHHDLMQEGMKLMGMASAGMQGMGMMGSMHSQTGKDPSAAPPGAHHEMMLKRMDMMQGMMQMMMDRMPAAATTTP
ncbi:MULTISPECIES: hypothetical protein [Alcaligenaceae]|uniref:Uncharacterized protein n=2 Tax=Alcaligenaceae TaxID=506 RepID=A0A4R3V610_9BURK|nr:hypothetical protein [Paracandidimonas soli]MDR4126715.1 hypothetical protein [Alcaligenaceae bacterium LG-2]MEB2399614.1 hypothetical protein [Alcaligenaceae bacterium]NYT24479.1 hypothetical protein [Alcaligenaceae bacterium]TCV00447.1 hypothetical protein EV686_10327 [Paracandidimonas soli]